MPAPWWQSTPTLTSAATTNGYNVPIVTGDIQEVEVSFPEPIEECDKSLLSGKGPCNIIPEWWCLQECQSSADQQPSSGQTTGLTWGDDQIVVPAAEMWDRESGLTPPAAWLVSTITTPGARLHLLAARECSTRDFSRPQNHQGDQVYRATQAHQAQQFIRPKDHQTTKVHHSPTTEEENASQMGWWKPAMPLRQQLLGADMEN